MTADTTLAPSPTEREQFEAWVEGPNNRIRRDPWGMYCQSHVQHMWEGWIAARFAQASAPQGPALVTLTDDQIQKLGRVGAVHTTDGVVTLRPVEYAQELEAQFRRGFRSAEKTYCVAGAANGN